MIKRILSIENPANLSLRDNQLIIRQWESENAIPFEDIGIIVLDNREISLRSSVFEACDEHGVAILHCNVSHMPVTISLPIRWHTLANNFLQLQLDAKVPTKKQLWTKIISEKILGQIENLRYAQVDTTPYENLLSRIKSGDPDNIEAQVAARYWKDLFWNGFVRERRSEGINAWLNYGYGVIRAAIARSVVAGWLHPSIGIWHDNQFNYFNLVDDLIEPFRPIVDRIVLNMLKRYDKDSALESAMKRELIAILSIDMGYRDRNENITSILPGYITSFRDWLVNSDGYRDSIERWFFALQFAIRYNADVLRTNYTYGIYSYL